MAFRKFSVILLLFCLGFCSASFGAEKTTPVKYVFLFIGDGFSIPQQQMAQEYLKRVNQPGLCFNSFPNQAITTTRSADSFITDSAAAGTAIACGEKTKSGQLGVDVAGTRRLVSVAEVARDAGRKVGIVTSVTLNHATPAAFYGHNISRGNGYNLGLDLLKSGFDYFAGGGIDRQDDKECMQFQGNIYDIASKWNYRVLHDAKAIMALKPGDGKVIACREKNALPYQIDHEEGLTLTDYTKKGIEMLDNPNGFFMMVEGGKIDWMCHANDAATVLHEIIEFNRAVHVALDFMAKHPNDTLIVVTGDHETGGLTLGFAGTGYKSYIERLQYQKCSLDRFREILQKILDEKNGTLSFDKLKPIVTEYFGLKFSGDPNDPMLLTKEEQAVFIDAFEKSFKSRKPSTIPFSLAVLRCFDNKAGLGWTSGAHTALPVDTSAIGINANRFRGAIDNTDISKILKPMVR